MMTIIFACQFDEMRQVIHLLAKSSSEALVHRDIQANLPKGEDFQRE